MNIVEVNIEPTTNGGVVLQYDDQFPPLPMSNKPKSNEVRQVRSMAAVANATENQSRRGTVSHTLVVPLAQRRFAAREGANHSEAQKKICQKIAQKCGVSIELNSSANKDQNLSLFVIGPLENVQNAKKILSKELQMQIQISVKVPKEYHKFILGRNGATLKEIENNSSTNITIPRAMEECEEVTIFGTSDGIEKAKFDINQIVIERSKLATERLFVPRRFYPFINGPNNVNINRIRDLTNVKINIPPAQSDNEEIMISGEKEGVVEATNIIKKIYNDANRNCSSLNLPIPKNQHRYVIGTRGSGISEILEKTGVSVEMPPPECEDDTIVLFGPNEQLAPALSLVIQKSESMLCVNIDAPGWLHRFIIGKSGTNLNKILENYEKVFVNFQDESDMIVIEGPKEDVKELKCIIERKIEELKRTMAVLEMQVDPRFHRHIIGRNGANIQRMQDDFKVQIRMPGTNATGQSSWTIKIEGDPSGVKETKMEIESMSVKLENEKTKDVILDHKYHNHLIGAQGTKVKELRTLFPDVIITFPDTSSKSDIVQLRGDRQQVDQVALKLSKLILEITENNYTKEVRILKQYHRNIIGKGGANIRKIREETNIRIEFPEEHSDSDVVRLTGKKQNVLEAAKKIEALQAQLVSVKEDVVSIPRKLHTSLIGVRGKFIKCIQDQCGGVIIQFPSSSDTKSDIITIRGLESDVEKAKKMLLEVADKNELLTYQESVKAKSEYHKFLIGRKGAQMSEFRKRHNGVMVIFPDNEDVDKDEIQLVGAKEAVSRARLELESTIKSLEDEMEVYMTVDPKWHRHFFKRRQAVMEEISREFGGVRLFFPKMDSLVDKMDQVKVVGPKGCLEAAIARVNDIVENLEAQTSISVFLEQRHHRNLIVRNMTEIKAIQTEYDVTIKFPNKADSSNNDGITNGGGSVIVREMDRLENEHQDQNGVKEHDDDEMEVNNDGDDEEKENELNNPVNLVMISGRKEQCELAKEALLELVPVTEEVELCNEYHRNLIGQKGQGVNTFSTKYGVNIKVPQANQCLDSITMIGTTTNIAEAKDALAQMVEVWEKEKQDRIARNFELSVDVPITFHRRIIGQRGTNIDLLRNKFNVNIQIPDQNSGSSMIVIRGYEEDGNKAAEELRTMVARLEAQVKEELHIPREVHPVLIGTRGINLRKLRDQFKVEVNFPGKGAEGDKAQVVEVIGDKDDVDRCCDHLIERANELLEEFEERGQLRGTKEQPSHGDIQGRHHQGTRSKTQGGFTLAGAPWQRVPDALSNDDFPTIPVVTDGAPLQLPLATTCLINGHSE